jgi:hypothetical protein
MSFSIRLPYDARVRRVQTTATLRYHRRRAESLRLHHLFKKKWCKNPPIGWAPYENALHLEDQASMLLTRLDSVCVKSAKSS